jgi:hypothetical protein
LATLPELRTCLELPYDLASLAGAPFDHAAQFFQDAILAHPLVPIAFVK